MERRVLAYLLVSASFMFIMMTMRPQQPQPKKEGLLGDEAAELADAEGEEAVAADETEPSEGSPEDDDVADRPSDQQWVTIGSMAAGSGDKLVITMTNKGAGIERIELVERDTKGKYKYGRVDTRSGYLGYLAPTQPSDTDGCIVNVVAPGSPAEVAGLQVGDMIIAAGGRAIISPEDLMSLLALTKPDEDFSVEVERTVAGARQSITLSATLTEHPLDLVRLSKWGGPDQVKGNISRLSCLMTLAKLNDRSLLVGQTELTRLPSLYDGFWKLVPIEEESRTGFEFRFPISASEAEAASKGSGKLEVVRRYTLPVGGSGFDIDLQTEIVNLADKPQKVAYRLEGPNGLTSEGWWYSTKISPNWTGGAGARDVVFNTASDYHRLLGLPALHKRANNNEEEPNEVLFNAGGSEGDNKLRYVGIDTQYFTTTYLPPADVKETSEFARGSTKMLADLSVLNRHQLYAANVTFQLDSVPHTIPSGGSHVNNMRIYAGPKIPVMLEQRGLRDLIVYGWFWFVVIPLSKFLHFLYAIFGNYGIAIIVLTICVRAGMFPLSRKAAVNAQKMQELAPEFKKIAEKHKDDMEKRMKAQQEIQKKHGFNPLSGCLPMFVQLPIFIGLYRALSVDIELRQAAFIPGAQWCSNLAAPDMLVHWEPWLSEWFSGRGTGWFGPYFNILPIIVMVLFIAQQKMFMPPPTDEQQEITQKVMFFMTFMMGFFFFKVAAGLCVYFITSSLWGMAERILVKKTIPQSPVVAGATVGGPAASPTNGATSGSLKSAPPEKDRPKKPPKRKNR